MEQSGLAALLEVADKNCGMDLERLLEGRVTGESLALFNVDGTMHKTAKSQILEFFKPELVGNTLSDYKASIDMGLI